MASSLPDTLISGPHRLIIAASVAALNTATVPEGCKVAENTRNATIHARCAKSSKL